MNKYSMTAQGEWLNGKVDKKPTKLDKVFMCVTSVILLSGLIVKSVEVAFS